MSTSALPLSTRQHLTAVFDLVVGYKDTLEVGDVRHALRLLGMHEAASAEYDEKDKWDREGFARLVALALAQEEDEVSLEAAVARAWRAMEEASPLLPPKRMGEQGRAGPEHVKAFLAALGDIVSQEQAELVAERLDVSLDDTTFTHDDLLAHVRNATTKRRVRNAQSALKRLATPDPVSGKRG